MSESIVYIVRAGNGLVKIGTTTNLASRLGGIRTNNASELEVIRTLPGARPEEKWLHEFFAADRVRLEWFQFQPEMLTVVVPDLSNPIISDWPDDPSGTVGQRIALAMRRATGGKKGAVKEISTVCGVAPGTVERWLSGYAMNAENLLRLCQVYDEVWNIFCVMCGRDQEEERATQALLEIEARIDAWRTRADRKPVAVSEADAAEQVVGMLDDMRGGK